MRRLRTAAATATVALLLPMAAAAQQRVEGWSTFVSVTPIFESDTDLDQGGEVSAGGVLARFGVSTDLGGGLRAGIGFNYDYFDYSFTNPVAFGGVAPWGVLQRYGVSAPLQYRVSSEWMLGVTPSADWFRENGAQTSDALAWGAVFSATRLFADGNRIGLGLGVFDQIEDTSVFPFLIIDWRLGENWRLINPLTSGPTGGAGFEIDYDFGGGWSLGVGFSFRQYRFRLSEDGPVPNGIGEQRGRPVFLRSTYAFNRDVALHLYAGVVTAGKLVVEDRNGNLVREDDLDNVAPLFALTLIGRF
jgi:hypothetical protein